MRFSKTKGTLADLNDEYDKLAKKQRATILSDATDKWKGFSAATNNAVWWGRSGFTEVESRHKNAQNTEDPNYALAGDVYKNLGIGNVAMPEPLH